MGRISFQKRQKEMKRQEKQRMKAEKRALRKITKNEPKAEGDELLDLQVGEAPVELPLEVPTDEPTGNL
jgi:hypothetical protein